MSSLKKLLSFAPKVTEVEQINYGDDEQLSSPMSSPVGGIFAGLKKKSASFIMGTSHMDTPTLSDQSVSRARSVESSSSYRGDSAIFRNLFIPNRDERESRATSFAHLIPEVVRRKSSVGERPSSLMRKASMLSRTVSKVHLAFVPSPEDYEFWQGSSDHRRNKEDDSLLAPVLSRYVAQNFWTNIPWYTKVLVSQGDKGGEKVSVWNFVLKHDTTVRLYWDIIILILVVGIAVLTPFALAFTDNCKKKFCEREGTSYVQIVVDIFFFIDIFLNFHTSVKNEHGKPIIQHKKIAYFYVTKGWFFADVMSTIPFDFILSFFLNNRHILGFVRLLRLLKLGRTFRILSMFERYEGSLEVSGSLELAKSACMILALFCVGHWAACAFWIMVDLEDSTLAFYGYFEEQGVADSPNIFDKYLTALYWSAVTLTTIGYGDIIPSSNAERLFCTIVSLLSVSIFAYLIAATSATVHEQGAEAAKFRKETKELIRFMKEKNLPSSLQRRIHLFHKYCHIHNKNTNEEAFMSKLSKGMQMEVALHSHEKHLRSVPIFSGAKTDFFERMCMTLKTEFYAPNEIVFREGDYGDSMYVLAKGLLLLRYTGSDQAIMLYEGRLFGDIAVMGLSNSKRSGTICTVTRCDLRRIVKEDLDRLLSYYPEIRTRIRVEALWNVVRKAWNLVRNYIRKRRGQVLKSEGNEESMFTDMYGRKIRILEEVDKNLVKSSAGIMMSRLSSRNNNTPEYADRFENFARLEDQMKTILQQMNEEVNLLRREYNNKPKQACPNCTCASCSDERGSWKTHQAEHIRIPKFGDNAGSTDSLSEAGDGSERKKRRSSKFMTSRLDSGSHQSTPTVFETQPTLTC